jgi:alpha-beta hydrolase superfamily lysophospholipase
MKKETFTSFDGKQLACFLWDDVKNPKGVIQIVHGMTSHMKRYTELGEIFNTLGYIAYGDDHRPHGETAGLENIGKAGKSSFFESVLDEIQITKMLKSRYNLPVQLFAHSYGSFLAQSYITKNAELLDGVILSGSAFMGGLRLVLGKVLTAMQRLTYRMDEPNPMFFNISFKANNKPFASENLSNAWLSRDKEQVALYNNDPYCNFLMTHGFYYSMMRGLQSSYTRKALTKIPKDLPIFIISGSMDPLGGMGKKVEKLYNLYANLGLNVKMKLYQDVRHELTSDFDKDIVIREMVEFFDGNITR